MRSVVFALLAALVVLHQLDPFGDDGTLVFGFLPLPLAYHAALSLAAAFSWWLATKFAWPLDAEVEEELTPDAEGGRA